MAHYVVRFLKNVAGNNGYEREACQGSFETEAGSPAEASQLAEVEFCRTERTADWSLYADRIEATEANFPS
jgi:hypothetical protein